MEVCEGAVTNMGHKKDLTHYCFVRNYIYFFVYVNCISHCDCYKWLSVVVCGGRGRGSWGWRGPGRGQRRGGGWGWKGGLHNRYCCDHIMWQTEDLHLNLVTWLFQISIVKIYWSFSYIYIYISNFTQIYASFALNTFWLSHILCHMHFTQWP